VKSNGIVIKEVDMPKVKSVEELTFEEAYNELQLVVEILENEQRPLEEAMSLFERGQALIKRCSGLLDKAELKVKRLSGETLVNFETEE
jgi:exodeoxyribonuclease VII small subunit